MTMEFDDKKNKIIKVKDSLSKFKFFVNEIISNGRIKMRAVLKKSDDKKTQEILEELKKM